jgi:hypothetical protein
MKIMQVRTKTRACKFSEVLENFVRCRNSKQVKAWSDGRLLVPMQNSTATNSIHQERLKEACLHCSCTHCHALFAVSSGSRIGRSAWGLERCLCFFLCAPAGCCGDWYEWRSDLQLASFALAPPKAILMILARISPDHLL